MVNTEEARFVSFSKEQHKHIAAIIKTGGIRLGARAILLVFPNLTLKQIGEIARFFFSDELSLYRQNFKKQ